MTRIPTDIISKYQEAGSNLTMTTKQLNTLEQNFKKVENLLKQGVCNEDKYVADVFRKLLELVTPEYSFYHSRDDNFRYTIRGWFPIKHPIPHNNIKILLEGLGLKPKDVKGSLNDEFSISFSDMREFCSKFSEYKKDSPELNKAVDQFMESRRDSNQTTWADRMQKLSDAIAEIPVSPAAKSR